MIWTTLLLSLLACDSAGCPTWYTDLDADGYGTADSGVQSCVPLPGRADAGGDCNDKDPDINPGARDVPADGRDQDCDGEDLCAGARVVESLGECRDSLVVLSAPATQVPAGGCLCASQSDLSIPGGTPPEDLASLHAVDGLLTLRESQADWTLPSLRHVGDLSAGLLGHGLSAPALESASALSLYRPGDVDLRGLERCDSLLVSEPEGVIDMSSLAEVGAGALQGSESLEGWDLGDSAHFGSLSVEGGTASGLPRSGLSVDVLVLRWLTDAQVTMDHQVQSLQIEGNNPLEVRELRALERLEVDNDGELSLPELETLEHLVNHSTSRVVVNAVRSLRSAESYGPLGLNALREADEILLHGEELSAPALEWVGNLEAFGATLPSLREAGEITLTKGDLPELWRADRIDDDADGNGWSVSVPKLREVDQASGQLHAPLLVELPSTDLVAKEGALSGLRYVSGDLTLEKSCQLSGLRSVDGLITLRDCEFFYAPALREADGILILGSEATALPDPVPTGVRLRGFTPFRPMHWGTVQGGLLVDCDTISCKAPSLRVDVVEGKVVLETSRWSSLGNLSLGRVEGDLYYCLPFVPTTEVDAWLESIDIGGTVEETCP